MRKLIAILGGFSLMSSAAISTVGCVDDQNNVFVLKTSSGEVIDTFKKNDVVGYYFSGWNSSYDDAVGIVIDFKNSGVKDYGYKIGSFNYWIIELTIGLKMMPNQDKYNASPIEPEQWKSIGFWDYDNNRPREPYKPQSNKRLREQ